MRRSSFEGRVYLKVVRDIFDITTRINVFFILIISGSRRLFGSGAS